MAKPPPLQPLTALIFNSGLTGYHGSLPGQLVVDTGTLISLAKSDLSGGELNLLLGTGRQLVITREVVREIEAGNSSDVKTFTDWLSANSSSIKIVPPDSSVPPGSNAGEAFIIAHVQNSSTGIDTRFLSEDIR